jgi:hypothetical protein
MAPLLEMFLDLGGSWITILGALAWIAYARLSSVQDDSERWVAAMSTGWVMKAAVVIALLAWVWSFGRLYFGDAYLRGSGFFAELSTVLLAIVAVLAALAWLSISRSSFHPWATYAMVMALIVGSVSLLAPAPKTMLVQGGNDNDRRTVAFVQGRLDSLGCFAAAGEAARSDGTFEALTALAFISFQAANNLNNPDLDMQPDRTIGIRPGREFSLFSRPFPFLFGPNRCSALGA